MSTDLNPDTEDTRRDELRVKIEASERRIAERTLSDQAREAAESAVEYTKANPLKVIGGALAVGLLIGLMTKPGRRVATSAATSAAGAATSAASAVGGAATSAAKTVGDATGKRGSRFGALIADALVGYGITLIDNVMDGAQASKDKLEDVGDSATAKARELRREATYIAGSAADKTRTATRRTRRRAERAVRDLTERVRG
jgi:ElaB/YqjD/DUF883 family membrane-anchored ribosome-binding protein